MFAVQYSMDDETEGAGNINWSNLLNAPKGPYGGDGFFLPSQNLINAYKTDAYGLPLFDTFNNSDYGTYEGNELTNVEATVDPRLDLLPVVRALPGKLTQLSLAKQTGYVTVANMALTAPSAFTSRLKVKICSRGGLGEPLILTGR